MNNDLAWYLLCIATFLNSMSIVVIGLRPFLQ